jgi:hypothetical protein
LATDAVAKSIVKFDILFSHRPWPQKATSPQTVVKGKFTEEIIIFAWKHEAKNIFKMAMLAEARSKQKWSEDPRNTKWSSGINVYWFNIVIYVE